MGARTQQVFISIHYRNHISLSYIWVFGTLGTVLYGDTKKHQFISDRPPMTDNRKDSTHIYLIELVSLLELFICICMNSY